MFGFADWLSLATTHLSFDKEKSEVWPFWL